MKTRHDMGTRPDRYKPKGELYLKGVAVIGVLATAAGCGATAKHNLNTTPNTNGGNVPTETGACTPVVKEGEKPEKLNFPANFYYGPDVSEGQGQLGVETAVQAYRKLNEVANVIIDIPLDSEGISGNHFKMWPLDNAPAWVIDVSDFKFEAGQDSTPTDQLVYEIDYPGCANVNGVDWIYVDTFRVFPQYAQSALSPQTVGNWQVSWSLGGWIKVSDVGSIPGVKIYRYKTSANLPIIKGHYDVYKESDGSTQIGDIHFPGIADNAYITLNAVDKSSADTLYKSGVQIQDLGQYLAGH